MLETLVVRIAATVAAAGLAVPIGAHVAAQNDAPPSGQHAPQDPEPRSDRTPHGTGSVDAGIGPDGMRFQMEATDPQGATGHAGFSVTDDGMRLQMHSDSVDGQGGVEFSITDHGVVFRFDADAAR